MDIFREQIAPHLEEGDVLGFSHGFNIRYFQIVPPENVDVVMVAPKGPGDLVRRTYQEDSCACGTMSPTLRSTGA